MTTTPTITINRNPAPARAKWAYRVECSECGIVTESSKRTFAGYEADDHRDYHVARNWGAVDIDGNLTKGA